MKFILPVVLLLIGLAGGVGAGFYLAPEPPEHSDMSVDETCGPDAGASQLAAIPESETPQETVDAEKDYIRLSNQFVVPVVQEDRVKSLVVVSLSVEVPAGQEALVFDKEPKLRDAFLQVLFEHANLGGFEGNFTSSANMRPLRDALRIAARQSIGPDATDVLILEMVRQDV